MTEPLAPVYGLGAGLDTMLGLALDALVEGLAGTMAGPVGNALLAPGSAVPADWCCACGGGATDLCGQAHVRLSRLWPSTVFPVPDASIRRCSGELAVEVELGVFRCAAGLDEDGSPPPPERVAYDARVALDDLAAMHTVASSTFGRTPVVVGEWTPIGPSGYCHGGQLLFTVAFNPLRPLGGAT